ncbi:hypothetical protein P8452_31732 [Trifolium repens]|nr:hypothetical protein P8452_31732 [Trifolium repens]
MAASSSSSRNVTIYAVDDAEPIIVDGSTFVSEPDMTSVEDTIWGEELMIPHKLRGRTLAFAGPLPSSDNFNEEHSSKGLPKAKVLPKPRALPLRQTPLLLVQLRRKHFPTLGPRFAKGT